MAGTKKTKTANDLVMEFMDRGCPPSKAVDIVNARIADYGSICSCEIPFTGQCIGCRKN